MSTDEQQPTLRHRVLATVASNLTAALFFAGALLLVDHVVLPALGVSTVQFHFVEAP